MGSTFVCLCKCSPASPLLPPRSLFQNMDRAVKACNPQDQSMTSSGSAIDTSFHIPAIRIAKDKVKHPTEFQPHENLDAIYTKSKKPDLLLKDIKIAKFLGFHVSSKALLVMKIPHVKSECTDYKLYCLKEMKKHATISFEVIKALPQGCSNPFLASIKAVYEGDTQVYFLNEYVSGGKLFDVMMKSNLKNEMLIAFIMGEVLLALEYLHNFVGIPCGNLKTSNIHLTSRGHIALTDFGICRKYTKSMNVEDFLFFAPEVLEGAAHDTLSDFWSFGVFLTLVLTSKLPFENSKDRDILEKDIKEGNIVLPDGLGLVALNLISRLLMKKREERIGRNGIEEVKRHAFFAQVKWEMLRGLKLRSPFVMKGKNVTKEGSRESLNGCNNGVEDMLHSVMHFLK